MVRETEAEIGIPQTIVHYILTEHLFKKKVAAQWEPHALIGTQKQHIPKLRKNI